MKYSSSLSNPPPLPPPNTFTLVLSRDELLLVRQGLGKNPGSDGANMVLRPEFVSVHDYGTRVKIVFGRD